MLYLILYDITTSAIRTKVAKILIKEGFERLQLSVYLGLDNPKKNLAIWMQLEKILKDEEDAKFYIFPIPKSSITNMQVIGKNDLDIAYLIGSKKTYFI